jgi:hypothetical protein
MEHVRHAQNKQGCFVANKYHGDMEIDSALSLCVGAVRDVGALSLALSANPDRCKHPRLD